jgi:tetratricopeptide (TPR) repeat protein
MESLGPRQRHQAMLIRLTLDGYSIAEIARQTGRHRTTIPKELNGTSEKEDDGTGNKIVYHQAGAYDVFRAIYTSAIFDLKRGEPDVWKVVDRRDFSSDEVRPSFTSIVREPSITKREAIEHYIDGWDWISKGGRIMPGRKDDKDEKQPEPPQPTRLSMKASEMQHPDSHALLSFAEDTLDREARGRIAAHTLICESCSAELEHIETETLPEMERPISVMERLSWLAARLVGRVRGSRETEEKGRARVWISAWVRMEAYDLRQEADQAMLSSRGDVSCEAAHNFLLEGIALYQAGRVREALAPWTNAEFIFRLQGLEGEGALCEMYVGVALVNLGQPQLAIEHHERARAVLARLGFKEQVADCEMYIGVALVNLGQPQQAIEHYKRARAVFAGLGFKKQVADCEMGIGVALVDLGQPQQAIEHYERARAVFFPLGFERVVADCEMRIGNALSGLGRPQEAIEHYQRAKAIFTRIGFENEVADCEMRISSALSDLGHQQEATEHYQRARDIYFRLGFHKELANDEMNIGSTLSDLCQQQQAIEPHEPESEPGLRALVVQGTDETYRFLTVLDEEEAGELYLFMSIYGEHKGPVYCWEVKGAQVELPFIPDEKERRHYQAYLTDREVPVPEGVHLNPKINADERSEERRQLLAAFLGALERGEVNYRAAEQDWL